MNFLYPNYLYFLILVPFVFVILFFVNRSRYKKIFNFISRKNVEKLVIGFSRSKHVYKTFLLTLSIVFFILSIARPRWGKTVEEVFVSANNVVIVFDVSKSMLAEDLKPSRLSQAKHSVLKFIDNLSSARLALIAFSASAVLVSPLSSDHEALKMYLNSLDTDFLSSNGTSLAKGLKMASELLVKDQNVDAKKIILLVTDGEDHEGNLPIDFMNENKISVYSLAVGLESGAAIPVFLNNGMKSGYVKDANGNIVISKVNTKLLNEISSRTGGKVYYTSFSGEEVLSIIKSIEGEDGDNKIKDKFNIKYTERYRYSLIPGILLFILGVLL